MTAAAAFERKLFGLKPLDYLIILAAAAAIAAFGLFAYAGSGRDPRAVIESEQGRWLYGLDAEQELVLRGPVGRTTVAVRGGAVRVLDSDCPDKLCINFGAARRHGDWIACLPNRVFIRVEGRADGRETDVDATAF